ncbi:MAG: hypothetical protein WD690_16235 [Vicinamibacterales bacterium]
MGSDIRAASSIRDLCVPKSTSVAFELDRERIVQIVTDAATAAGDRERALEAGYDAHIPKPVDTEKLLTTMFEVLRSRALYEVRSKDREYSGHRIDGPYPDVAGNGSSRSRLSRVLDEALSAGCITP